MHITHTHTAIWPEVSEDSRHVQLLSEPNRHAFITPDVWPLNSHYLNQLTDYSGHNITMRAS